MHLINLSVLAAALADPAQDPGGFFDTLINAAQHRAWWMVLSLLLTGAVAGVRWAVSRYPDSKIHAFLNGSIGSLSFVFASSFATAWGTALLAGQSMSWIVLMSAVKVAAGAVFAYEIAKATAAKVAVKKPDAAAAPTPPPLPPPPQGGFAHVFVMIAIVAMTAALLVSTGCCMFKRGGCPNGTPGFCVSQVVKEQAPHLLPIVAEVFMHGKSDIGNVLEQLAGALGSDGIEILKCVVSQYFQASGEQLAALKAGNFKASSGISPADVAHGHEAAGEWLKKQGMVK